MKLRSDSRAAAASKKPIPYTLPATEAISISNASSPLLRLPQELKDRIYYYLYGGFHFKIYLCWNQDKCFLRGEPVRFGYKHCLTTCRQIYLEARNKLYSANTFVFAFFEPSCLFLRSHHIVSYGGSAVRRIKLEVSVTCRQDERKWNKMFHMLTETLNNVRHLHIDIEERMWNDIWNDFYRFPRRLIPVFGKRHFLEGMLEFKKLSLQTFQLVMVESRRGPCNCILRSPEYTWTMDQKREWAQEMKSAIMSAE